MSRRARNLLLLVLLAFIVNLPLLNSSVRQWRVEHGGVDITATVVDHGSSGSGAGAAYWLTFRFPERIDPDRRSWQADVDRSTYRRAVGSGELRVRVLEDDPSVYDVAGGSALGRGVLVATLVVDVLLAIAAVFLWRGRGRRRPQLRAVAMEDVRRSDPGTLLERVDEETYVVRGSVTEADEGRVVLDVGSRSVEVLLGGHANPVGREEAAEVMARLIG